MSDMDEYMRCLDEIAFTNHIVDAKDDQLLVMPEGVEPPLKKKFKEDDEESKHDMGQTGDMLDL